MSDEKKYADWYFTAEDFGLRLKHFRKERGYTQDQLAALIGKGRGIVYAYEAGLRKPKLETILKFAAALEIDVEDLIYGNEQSAQQDHEKNMSDDVISRQAVFNAMHLCDFIKVENSEGDVRLLFADDLEKRINAIPSAQPTLYGYNIEHLAMIARVLQKEDLPPDRLAEILTDIGRIVTMVQDEFEEALRKAVEQCKRM